VGEKGTGAQMNRSFLIIGIVVAVLSLGIAYKALEPSPFVGLIEYGLASYYGKEFHGKRTASGEIFNMYRMTAAHRYLPFGSVVMVTRVDTGRSVIVRINDRGPYVEGRIIDLSFGAARRLGMIEEGVVRVRLEVLR